MQRQEFKTKSQAIKFLANLGYVPGQREDRQDAESNSGQNGDYAYGSRLYFHNPEGGYNSFGFGWWQAQIDRFPGYYSVAIFS